VHNGIAHSLAAAANDFLVASGPGAFVKKTLAQTAAILRSSLDSVYAAAGHEHLSRQAVLMHALGATVPAGGILYLVPAMNGLVGMNGIAWPVPGTFTNLTFKTNSAQPATGSLVATLQNGFGNTIVVGTVPAGAGAYTATSANSASFSAGQVFCIAIKNNASAASAVITFCSVEFRADTL
jgi:hypothetical protein